MSDETLIGHVSDTARWVAVYRAMETERPDALFRDPFARRLAGAHGEAIVQSMKRGQSSAWPMIVRTKVLDDLIQREVDAGVDTVLNLGSGLDARAFRMPLPPTLHWIDVDHPSMIEYKVGAMVNERPACRYEAVPLDLADVEARQALFARVNASARKMLVVTEGLLIYLSEAAVIRLATDLHGLSSVTAWLADLGSPQLLKMMSRNWGKTVAAGNAPFQFGPAEGPAFFDRFGWRALEYHSLFETGIRLNRTFALARFFRWLGTFSSAKRQAAFKHFAGVMSLVKR